MALSHNLEGISEGMKVYDRARDEIGHVEFVQFGDDDPSTPEPEAASLATSPMRREGLVDVIADIFHPDDHLPDELRQKLLQQGFIRIDADGIFASDRYVTPDQIASVSADGVMLSVSRDELLKH